MHKGRARRFAAGVALALPLLLEAQGSVMLPAGVVASCHEVAARMAHTTGEPLFRREDVIRDDMIAKPVRGCLVRVEGSRKRLGDAPMPTTTLYEFFEKYRWSQLVEFSADGHDGTAFAYARADVACLVRGEWDGGTDDEPDAPVADPYLVTVLCGDRASFVRRQ